jgi:hypothetical protein
MCRGAADGVIVDPVVPFQPIVNIPDAVAFIFDVGLRYAPGP